MFAEGVGMLIAFLDSGALDLRRYTVVSRLRRLHDSDGFATLPEDLRERIRDNRRHGALDQGSPFVGLLQVEAA
jgi:hypothetical protein